MLRKHLHHRKHEGQPETSRAVDSRPTDKTQGSRPTEGRKTIRRDETRVIRSTPKLEDSATAAAERTAHLSSLTSRRKTVVGVAKQVTREHGFVPHTTASEEKGSNSAHVTITTTAVSSTFVEEKTTVVLPAVDDSNTPPREEVSPSSPAIFALLVAIDKYSKNGIRELKGCVNDAKDFHDYLKTTHNVPPRNILTLLNESATRDNILAAFNSHLVQNAQITTGDLIFFFYAGHGDRVEAPDWNDDKRMVETICPYDVTVFEENEASRDTDDAGSVTYGIPDRTFNGLMRQLAKEKGDNIVAIFDCCHSGGIARDTSGVGRALSDSENLKQRPSLPLHLDRELFRGVFDQDSDVARGLHMLTPDGFAYSGAKSHVLLAACQSNQKARELAEESGKHHGRFTYHLLLYLRNDFANRKQPLTYASLVDVVAQRMVPKSGTVVSAGSVTKGGQPAGGSEVQQPHCEGRNRHRLLFTTEEEARSDSFPLTYQPQRLGDAQSIEGLYVNVGSARGVSSKTLFVYRYRATTGEPYQHITLVPKDVEAHRSRLVVMGDESLKESPLSKQTMEGRLPEQTTVAISTWGYRPMKVWYEQGVPRAGTSNGSVDRFTKAGSSDDADICCNPGVDMTSGYTLKRRDPLIAHFEAAKPVVHLPSSFRVREGASIFNDIAHFNYHLYHCNNAVMVKKDLAFDVHFYPLERHDDSSGIQARYRVKVGAQDLLAKSAPHLQGLPEDISQTYSVCGLDGVKEARITDVESYYGITVVSKSDINMFVYVFYFDPETYSIMDWYHPPNNLEAPLPKRGSLSIGHGRDNSDTFKFSLADGSKRETGFLKVFVSNVYIDMSGLVQESPFGDSEAALARLVVQRKPVQESAGWSSSVYALTVIQE